MDEFLVGERELDVMGVLWELGSGTVTEVRDKLPVDLAYTTVLTILRNLEEKEFVTHKSEGRAHRYFPKVARNAAQKTVVARLVDKLFQGSSEQLIAHLVEGDSLTAEELKRLRASLADAPAKGTPKQKEESMIASWMVFSVATAVLIGVTALAIEFIVIAKQRPARLVWLTAMVASLVVPILAYMRAPLTVQAVAPSVQGGVVIGVATAIASPSSLSDVFVSLDRPLLVIWILASVALTVRLAHAMHTVRSRTRDLPRMTMRGVDVRESSNLGPAVVGIAPMEVVLPGWARELDAPLRDLVLRHEDEHRNARDPYLLLAAAILAAIMPWNIGLLWQVRRLRLAVEVDCDARVLRVHPDRERYGLLLLAVAQRRTAGSLIGATAMSEPASNLERRINAMKIASANISKARLAGWSVVAAGAVAIACSVDAPTRPAAQAPADSSITLTPSQLKYATVSATMDSILDSYNTALKRVGSQSAEYDSVRALLANLERAVGGGVKTVLTRKGVLTLERGSVPDAVITLKRDTVRSDTVRSTSATAPASSLPVKVNPSTAFGDFQVERQAALKSGTANPVYPAGLKGAGIEGEVIAQFVVGADGKADVATFKVIRSTDPLFTASVREALAQMEFVPATVGGRPVKQLLQLPFAFSFHQ